MTGTWPHRLLVPILLFPLAIVGCGKKVTRSLISPSQAATLDQRSPYLKAHRADGGVYVLDGWSVDPLGGRITGSGVLLDPDRVEVSRGEFRIPADSVVLLETNVLERSSASTGLTVMAGVTAAIAGVCAASPKTCFGSCPTFYAPGDGGRMILQAEGFSSSIAPALEATDVDMLLHSEPGSGDYRIRVTNEALETHVLRHVDLLAVPRPEGGRVHRTPQGSFVGAMAPVPPTKCIAPEGDCSALLTEADGVERASLADSTDLAAKEILEMQFSPAPSGEMGLVVVSRQTLMTTFLVYQALAYLGHEAGRWLASLHTGGDEAIQKAQGVGDLLGKIEVLVPDTQGGWERVGEVGETGPIASDSWVVPLPRPEGEEVRVRLRMTRGLWRLDQVALAGLSPVADPVRIAPSEVRRSEIPDSVALRALTDPGRTVVTLPGDELEIGYRLPESSESFELFLEARGYYLEWMREEWLDEENLARAAQFWLDPSGALRDLAPAFKREEPRIETLFWNSRYVRH